jgi:hypothetical protein
VTMAVRERRGDTTGAGTGQKGTEG